MIMLFTRRVSYPAPHITTGFEHLLGRLPSKTGLAYGVIDGQVERRVAVGQWKPKT